jgi:hypothetical protein
LAPGLEVVTRYDQQGFPVVVTVDPAAANGPKSFDSQGLLITSTAGPATTGGADAVQAEGKTSTGFAFPSAVPANEAGSISILPELAIAIGILVMAAAVMN